MKVFRSKVGYELLKPIALLFGAILVLIVLDRASIGSVLAGGGVLLSTYAFILYSFLSTNYTITDNYCLLTQCGFIKFESIDINTISSITKTNDLISFPAPSLDRIEVFYDKYSSIISPKDKLKLVRTLQKINPRISYNPKGKAA